MRGAAGRPDLRGAARARRDRPHRRRDRRHADRPTTAFCAASSTGCRWSTTRRPIACPPTAPGSRGSRPFSAITDAEAFVAELRARLGSVERHYAELFEEAPSLAGPGNLVFTGTDDDPETLATLARLGFAEPARVAAMVRGWHHGRIRATRSQRAREILTEFVPELLRVFGATANPDTALLRFDQFLSTLPAGVQLFSLFHANPGLFSLVADIMAEAPLLAEQPGAAPGPARRGADGRVLRPPARPRRARRRSRRRCWRARAISRTRSTCCGAGPTSAGFRSACSCCAARSTATRPAPRSPTSPRPRIAALLPRGRRRFRAGARRGAGRRLRGRRDGPARQPRDDARLRSRPDPDLRRARQDAEASLDGPRPLAVSTYYARLSQRLISAITAPTAEGRLYEVDMRLRPSGEAGPIASSLAAFAQYQRESAWTWEHMALTRARPIAGDPGAVRARRRRDPGGADPAARPGPAASPMSPTCAAASPRPIRRRRPWDLRNRPRRAHRSRIHRAIPAAARGRGAARAAACAIRPRRSRRSERPAHCRRKARASWARR